MAGKEVLESSFIALQAIASPLKLLSDKLVRSLRVELSLQVWKTHVLPKHFERYKIGPAAQTRTELVCVTSIGFTT